MIGMQYKINLPNDYDMNIIKERVRQNGSKTDGFDGLLFKCYLIQEKDSNNFANMYAPLYLWNKSEGMNRFLFEGFYDNIINSFGWQSINVGIPITVELSKQFKKSRYVIEITNDILPDSSLTKFPNCIESIVAEDKSCTGQVCIYNTDKWRYSLFRFYTDFPDDAGNNNIYQILHISEG